MEEKAKNVQVIRKQESGSILDDFLAGNERKLEDKIDRLETELRVLK